MLFKGYLYYVANANGALSASLLISESSWNSLWKCEAKWNGILPTLDGLFLKPEGLNLSLEEHKISLFLALSVFFYTTSNAFQKPLP